MTQADAARHAAYYHALLAANVPDGVAQAMTVAYIQAEAMRSLDAPPDDEPAPPPRTRPRLTR